MPCPNLRNGDQNCKCAPPVKSAYSARLIFVMALVGGILFLMFNNFKGYEAESLNLKSLGMISILGFLTGLHCIGMCGGFMMSYVNQAKKAGMSSLEMHGKYAISKVLSYTAFGALFGALGSLIYFSNGLKSGASLAGGAILLFLGAKGLGLFRNFDKFSLPLDTSRFSGPIGIGLMKGLMISCGPLQALYLLAAGLGSPLEGAKMLAVFGISTLPIFLFYGSVLSSMAWFKSRWADIVTSCIVVIFGVMMLSRGMALGGYSINIFDRSEEGIHQNDVFTDNDQSLYMEVGKRGFSRKHIYFQAEKPICWEVYVSKITNCNKTIEIPEFNISKDLELGYNYIEFEPQEQTQIPFTCWMGMMKGEFNLLPTEVDSMNLAHVMPE